jgi:hypothetical protein
MDETYRGIEPLSGGRRIEMPERRETPFRMLTAPTIKDRRKR